ncbi:MAG: cell division topological specificity factor MinE [Pseudanabaena sp. CRU_2_10]|nr:cell division topological specificity factor MinE [Pseudanabaena sp. CRU_2_10]
MIIELLERLFGRDQNTSRTKVKQRLKFILAHDRAAISPQIFEQMRREIMQVVSKYVELEEENIEINLESDRDLTAVIANLPICSIRLIPPPEEKPSVTTSQTPSQTPSETVQSQTPGETVQSLPVAPELEFDLSELDRKFEVAQDIAKQE